MGQIQYITGTDTFEGLSLGQICKKTGHHLNTLKKYVDCDNWKEKIKPQKERSSRLDELKPVAEKGVFFFKSHTLGHG